MEISTQLLSRRSPDCAPGMTVEGKIRLIPGVSGAKQRKAVFTREEKDEFRVERQEE